MRATMLLVVAFALPARGEAPPQLSKETEHALTPIDTVPTKEDIQRVFPQNTVSQLAALAKDGSGETDFGVRLRAIRALPQFCTASCAGQTPHTTIVELARGLRQDLTIKRGTRVLLTRAAVEALGAIRSGDSNDVAEIAPFLDHANRDIRAAAAYALRDLCDQAAVTPLRNRYNIEMGAAGVPQVRLAISAALRDLGTCGN